MYDNGLYVGRNRQPLEVGKCVVHDGLLYMCVCVCVCVCV